MKLERQVPIRHAVGTSEERRYEARVAARVTLWRVLVASALLAPPILLAFGARATDTVFDETRLLVRRYAFEAFPQWAQLHHQQACPQTIAELSPLVGREHARDPWGTDLELRCGEGIRFLYVRSAGPDRTFATADDITSND